MRDRNLARCASALVLLSLAGCTTTFTHPNKGQQDFHADMAYCESMGRSGGGNFQVMPSNDAFTSGWNQAAAVSAAGASKRITLNCMYGLGWREASGRSGEDESDYSESARVAEENQKKNEIIASIVGGQGEVDRIATDPGFLRWMREIDPKGYGGKRRDSMNRFYRDGNAEAVAKFYTDWQAAQDEIAYQKFEAEIRARVPDYDELMSDQGVIEINKFIEMQKPSLRRAYRLTIESGTVDEVVDLLTDFKAYKAAQAAN